MQGWVRRHPVLSGVMALVVIVVVAAAAATGGGKTAKSTANTAATSSASPTPTSSAPTINAAVAQKPYASKLHGSASELINANSLLQGCSGRLTQNCIKLARLVSTHAALLQRQLRALHAAGSVGDLVVATADAAKSVTNDERTFASLGCKPGSGSLCSDDFGSLQIHADQLATQLEQWAAFAQLKAAPVPQSKYTPPPPKPVTYSGSGDDVIRIRIPGGGPGIITATYSGDANFIVDAHGTGEELAGGENLINTIGAYHGTVAVDFSDGRAAALQVQASGTWTFRIADALAAPRFGKTTSGAGDAVIIYKGSSSIFHITNQNGDSNFIVDEYTAAAGDDNLVNEIGHYAGTVLGDKGPAFFVIQSNGNWTVTAR
jgi:hypothetical protein